MCISKVAGEMKGLCVSKGAVEIKGLCVSKGAVEMKGLCVSQDDGFCMSLQGCNRHEKQCVHCPQ